MRAKAILILMMLPFIVQAEPELIWTSATYDGESGFVPYSGTEYRWVKIDNGLLSVSDAAFSETPIWSIPIENGSYFYSTYCDITGDEVYDLYIIRINDDNERYRIDFIDMSNGNTYLSLSEPGYVYSYAVINDFDGDGQMEIDVQAWDEDYVTTHFVYSTDGSTALAESGSYTLPDAVNLAAPWPNPTNAGGRVSFSLETPMNVRLQVYSIEGRLVRDLANQTYTAGTHQLFWDGKSDSGVPVASGSYFLSLQAGDSQPAVKQMIILK